MATDFRKYKIFTRTPWNRNAAVYYGLLVFVSVFYAVVFDDKRAQAAASDNFGWAMLLAASALYSLALFYILSLSRWAFLVVCPLLFHIGSVGRIYFSEALIDTGKLSAPLFFANSVVGELAASPENAVFLSGMFALGLALGLVRFFYAADDSVVRKGQAFAVILILAAGAAGYIKENYPYFTPQPFAYFGAMQKYAVSFISFGTRRGEETPKAAAESSDDIAAVIILVEKFSDAAFSDKFAMPLSSREGALFYSGADALTGAYRQKLRPVEEKGEKFRQTWDICREMVSLFKSAGFPTLWFAAENSFLKPDGTLKAAVSKTADEYIVKFSPWRPNPFLALDKLEEFFKANPKGLFILETGGIPPKISSRYPESFNKNPGESGNYKNYAEYTDALIYEVVRKLNGRKSFIIFSGLAGEKPEDDPFGPGALETKTGAILWISPKLEKEYGLKEKAASKDIKALGENWLFHSAGGCALLKSSAIKPESDLCADKNRPRFQP